MSAHASARRSNRRLAGRLVVVVVAMFGFGYALVPLYDVFCEITGLGGKTGVAEESRVENVADTSRELTVEFLGTVSSGLPWEFRPTTKKMKIHPGRVYETTYFARNLADRATTGRAVPSVAPGAAGTYFRKTECFCFSEQRFGPGEGREMPVRFVVDRDLPADIRTISLSYTFFDAAPST